MTFRRRRVEPDPARPVTRDIEAFRANEHLSLHPTDDRDEAYRDAKYVIIATPTDYDPETNAFNTGSVDSVVDDVLRINPDAAIVIKSTTPVGDTSSLRQSTGHYSILFLPEFLREGKALHDNLYPSLIMVGDRSEKGGRFADVLRSCAYA